LGRNAKLLKYRLTSDVQLRHGVITFPILQTPPTRRSAAPDGA
jgi:hypothetical protein